MKETPNIDLNQSFFKQTYIVPMMKIGTWETYHPKNILL